MEKWNLRFFTSLLNLLFLLNNYKANLFSIQKNFCDMQLNFVILSINISNSMLYTEVCLNSHSLFPLMFLVLSISKILDYMYLKVIVQKIDVLLYSCFYINAFLLIEVLKMNTSEFGITRLYCILLFTNRKCSSVDLSFKMFFSKIKFRIW